MVNTVAFYLLNWIENPSGVLIEQGTTFPHHHDTLLVGPQWYMGLIDVVLVILLETIPPENTEEREMWLNVREEIVQLFERLRTEFWRKDEDGSLPKFEPERANWIGAIPA
jgi:hypothetical protein